MSSICQVARREVSSFFSSPVAFLFLASFLVINLFVFFWSETFFSRNLADVRPLFEWMPLLMAFLVAALTMRSWSEERRSGTIEMLLTFPITSSRLVLGKFIGSVALVKLAILLTLPIPITISLLGDLDWGPVIGGYFASVMLASAYIAIGLYVSAKTDNQIVSLILTAAVCFGLYLVGSGALTGFVGNSGSEYLQLLSTGARFDSITRGVLDLRDIYYFLSIIGAFLALNILAIEKLRWSALTQSKRQSSSDHNKSARFNTFRTALILVVVNLLLANIWMYHAKGIRLDLTQNRIYSISSATTTLLEQIQEPLTIRGYFSQRTHPLLAPLVPQIRDLLQEYQIAGGGLVRAEFIDPRENPELEEEASRKFGIKPVPFQVSDKYEAALINSYFDIVLQYGDQFEVLGFQDLIEVKTDGESEITVVLRNPEYDITRSIKKVLYGFQNLDSLFASLTSPVTFQGFISDRDKLPEVLADFKPLMDGVLEEVSRDAGDKFSINIEDPKASPQLAIEIEEQYGFRPMATSLFDTETFYFYMLLKDSERNIVVSLPEDFSKEGFQRSLEAALKRFSKGFIKTIGVVAPAENANPVMRQYQQSERSFEILKERLKQNYRLSDLDLSSTGIPGEVDILLLLAPKELKESEVFAIDQFLMKGGTIIAATSPYAISRTQTSLSATKHSSGLESWLEHLGLKVPPQLILDSINESYPVPVRRDLGGMAVQEIRLVPYPHFPDIRSDGMNKENIITSGLTQVTMNWSSPIEFTQEGTDDASEGAQLARAEYTPVLTTSESSWTSESANVIPDFEMFPELGFPQAQFKANTVAAVLKGEFESFHAKDGPPKVVPPTKDDPAKKDSKESEKESPNQITSMIERSPDSAQVILFASNEFLADQTLQISASTGSNRFLNSLQLLENALDSSLEDQSLLTIRNRGQFTRTLVPLDRGAQVFWEYLNYALAILGLLLVFAIYRFRRQARLASFREILNP